FVDGERLMRDVRAVKLPAEIECIRTAIAMTEGALSAIRDDVRPGVTELHVKGRFHEAMCRFGMNHPANEGTFCAPPRASSEVRLLPDGRALAAGDLVAVGASIPYAAYEGSVARTWPCTGPSGSSTAVQRSLFERWHAVHSAVVDACRARAAASDLRRAWID